MDNDQIAEAVFRGVEARIEKALGPLMERLEALESIEIPGAADVAKAILGGEEIRTLVDLHVTEAVAQIERVKGDPGDPGKDGEPGKDGIGLAGAIIDRDGGLVVTLTNGEAKSLGKVVGTDGKDGVGITDLVRSYDEQTHEIVERWGEKELRYPAGGIRPGGYWREGTKAVAAQVWNHAGVAWIAKRDTTAKPMRESADWEIFANKGRDGKDGVDGKAPPGPVSLRSASNA